MCCEDQQSNADLEEKIAECGIEDCRSLRRNDCNTMKTITEKDKPDSVDLVETNRIVKSSTSMLGGDQQSNDNSVGFGEPLSRSLDDQICTQQEISDDASDPGFEYLDPETSTLPIPIFKEEDGEWSEDGLEELMVWMDSELVAANNVEPIYAPAAYHKVASAPMDQCLSFANSKDPGWQAPVPPAQRQLLHPGEE